MRRLLIATSLLGLVSASGVIARQDPRATMTVGTASAARGSTAYGALSVAAGSDAGLSMQVAVINGAKPGKVVAFVAGSHGTEYTSIVALTRLIAKIDPKLLSGTVIVAPLLNVASFEQMIVHMNPIDKKGMNSGYPGNATGTQTERALALVADQIVKPADVVVDLHGGDSTKTCARTATGRARATRRRTRRRTRSCSRSASITSSCATSTPTNPASIRSLGGYSLAQGKTMIVAEAGRSGTVLTADVDALVNGCLNVLGSLKMIARPVTPVAKPVFIEGGSRVHGDRARHVLRDREARHDRAGRRRQSATRPTMSAADR